ncbi:exodeoxyribonuclease VII large subunit [Patescibacteria group bacterium]|nr:exodeoxyribonuclease VII large subunit [Patescibacteria group bacterium]
METPLTYHNEWEDAAAAAALSVSEFVDAFNEELAGTTFHIAGELGEVRVRGGGVYIKLNDQKAVLSCFMFLSQFKPYQDTLEEGMNVRVVGHCELHYMYGFSFRIHKIEVAGEGSLARAFALLQAKLEKEGIFDPSHKRTVNKFPQTIGVITSANGAALTDFLKRVEERFGGAALYIRDTYMEGARAVQDIIAGVDWFNEHMPDLDVLVITRGGGGKLENLVSFNDESVIKAIYGSKIPTVCAIGHERDVTLAELAADVRASTPTHIAEVLYPPREEVLQMLARTGSSLARMLDGAISTYNHALVVALQHANQYFTGLEYVIEKNSDRLYNTVSLREQAFREMEEKLTRTAAVLSAATDRWLRAMSRFIDTIAQVNQSFDPHTVMRRGFSIVRNTKGAVITSTHDLRVGEKLDIELFRGTIQAILTTIFD